MTRSPIVVGGRTGAPPAVMSHTARRGAQTAVRLNGSGSLLPVPLALALAVSPVAVAAPARRPGAGLGGGSGGGRGEGLLLLPPVLLGLLRLLPVARLCRRRLLGGGRR